MSTKTKEAFKKADWFIELEKDFKTFMRKSKTPKELKEELFDIFILSARNNYLAGNRAGIRAMRIVVEHDQIHTPTFEAQIKTEELKKELEDMGLNKDQLIPFLCLYTTWSLRQFSQGVESGMRWVKEQIK